MQSDETLIQELRQGSQEAMDMLIKRHYRMVFAYIYRYSGDYHISYDLTQETFMKMVRGIHTIVQHESFKVWLLAIARNTCRDYFNSKSYKTRQMSRAWDDGARDTQTPLTDPFDQKLERVLVKEAVMELPDYQRETILLRFYHDLKIKEIASLTAVGEPTVKSRIKQGLSKLKVMMERGASHDSKTNRE